MRFSRRAHMVGGPFDGGSMPLPLPDTMADPVFVCRLNGAAWEHYTRQDDGRYRYAGPCAEDCDGSGPWPAE